MRHLARPALDVDSWDAVLFALVQIVHARFHILEPLVGRYVGIGRTILVVI